NLDLAWKLDARVTLDRTRHQPEIQKLAEEILRRQQPDGTWAMPFDMEEVQYDFARQRVNRRRVPVLEGQQGPRSSDFQTYHAIYALARAGVTMDDPRLKKAVELCLARQTPSGAWQGRPDYKNFDTPFRDTQYALMALSTLFPAGAPARGWNPGFTPPSATFDESSEAALLATLDQYWEKPADPVAGRIRRLLQSPSPMVRYRAAVSLGRFADPNSLEPLAAKLGDPSKIVQRGAAWAVRQIVSRKPEARGPAIAILRASLNSADARVRWGATRIFNQHFKYFSEEWSLGEELLRMASSEPVPAVRMAAIQALYQWWFWDRNAEHKAIIEDTLIAGLGKDAHPWVRRNLIEAYYQTLDDNVRYLYGSWIPRVKRAEDRAAIDGAHKQHVRLQAVRYRDSMARGNTLARDGLLRALHTFHVREGLGDVTPLAGAMLPETVAGSWVNGYKWAALYDPLTGGSGGAVSIGNDSEGPTFYSDSAPVMQEALLAALHDDSPQILAGVLRTLKFLRLRIDAPLATRILARLDKPSAEIASLTAAAMTLAPLDDPAVREAIRTRWSKVSVDDRDFAVLVDLLPRMSDLRRDESILARVAEGLG
ncbi:MAG: HEAT repeat domain-containing protein, partial [Bryobacteraceae bacterium]